MFNSPGFFKKGSNPRCGTWKMWKCRSDVGPRNDVEARGDVEPTGDVEPRGDV